MGVIETVKDIGLLVQKLDNVDLVKRLVELQQQVYEVVTENQQLRELSRELKEQLARRERLRFSKNAYWLGDDGPFCARCHDAEGLMMRLTIRAGFSPTCPKCHTIAPDPDRNISGTQTAKGLFEP